MGISLALVVLVVATLGVQLIGVRRPSIGTLVTARRSLVAAVVVGGGLRLLWVIWATRAPTEPQDPAEYLRIATDLGRGILPTFGGGVHSAYWPPGYPALLAPFVWVARETGWASPAFTAALFNVVAGTATILLTGVLARRWLGPGAGAVAAWLIALCPALIYFTSTAHTETAFTPLLLGVILLADRATEHESWRRWAVAGLVLGVAFLVHSPAVIALTVPALTIRARRGAWRGALRPTMLVAVAAAVLLVPWAVRNGVQVGVWSPAPTSNASAACFGHHDRTRASMTPSLAEPRLQEDCFGGSPYDDPRLAPMYAAAGEVPPDLGPDEPDEPRWYRETMSEAVSWVLRHPGEEVVLSAQKVWATWGDEGRAVEAARNYDAGEWAGRWHDPLRLVADLWLWLVGVLALVALAVVPACRRALPVWVPIALLTLAIVGGIAEPHYRYPVVPMVAVLAAGLLARRDVAT
jgi:4-amino-4-deoxy-L-arabinose transferase-like glycosyltransferase